MNAEKSSVAIFSDDANVPAVMPNGQINLLNERVLQTIEKLAEKMSQSVLIPAHYQGKPQDCFVAYCRSQRLGVDPFAFMDQSYVVHGKLGLQGQLLIAVVNNSGLFETNMQFDIKGDEGDIKNMACTAWAYRKGTKIKCESYVAYKMAIDENWILNTKWQSMTRLMLTYRAAAFFSRIHCPEVALGMRLRDEIEDGEAAIANVRLFSRDGNIGEQEEGKTAPIEGLAEVVEDVKDEKKDNPEEKMNAPLEANVGAPENIKVGDKGVDVDTMRRILGESLKVDNEGEALSTYLLSTGLVKEGEGWPSLSDGNIEMIWNNFKRFERSYLKSKGGK